MKKEKLPEPLLAKSHQKSMWMKGRIPTALVGDYQNEYKKGA